MFTEGTRQFGVWKSGHPSTKRYFGKPTQALLLAYGFCAFLVWIMFILILKVRGEFFLIESLKVPLHRVSLQRQTIEQQHTSAVSMAVRRGHDASSLHVIFDSGELFRLPADYKEVEKFLITRASEIELTALLKKKLSPGCATADVWVDQHVPIKDARPLADLLVRVGFDTLRFAVDTQSNVPFAGRAH